jgi:hypothetical protein
MCCVRCVRLGLYFLFGADVPPRTAGHSRRAAVVRGPFACACGGGWNTQLRLPGRPGLLKVRDRRQFARGLRRQVWKAQHHGLNARAAEFAGLDQSRGAAQALVKAQDGFVSQRPIASAQNLSRLLWRPHHAATHAARIGQRARQIYAAERQALLIAGEPRPATGDEAIRALCR